MSLGEHEKKAKKEKSVKEDKDKSIALKSKSKKSNGEEHINGDESENDPDDEDMELFVRRFKKYIKGNGVEFTVIANRLRLVIGNVIFESQTAIVKDMQILDGILIANEAVDEARKSKKEMILFKEDFEKARDSVDWGYLDVVMGRMSFPTLWRKWMKERVCTATASILVNGSPTNEFPLLNII
ncbi:hypothetical protein TSUD_179910 [Trifolium subterraneum]|uniref:Uncharacterized protein n=1 Tax=Trifolium subterraneum TaxID=3900 RepID=A0A2Z6PSI7_TRISU|nr:hypothetical protein TSUD_179910 [Trifolium subterraneum]